MGKLSVSFMSREGYNEYSIAIENLEKLRLAFVIDMQEIDEYADLGKSTYSRIISGKQPIRLDQLILIGKEIYNLKAIQLLNPKMKFPTLRSLPPNISFIAKERLGKSPRIHEKRDLVHYCVLILHTHFKVGDEFTNSEIKSHLRGALESNFKDKAIEWHKSILANYIADTGEKKPGKTKPEKRYKLTKKIPTEMKENAIKTVGTEWLNIKLS